MKQNIYGLPTYYAYLSMHVLVDLIKAFDRPCWEHTTWQALNTYIVGSECYLNTLKVRQNGRHFADGIFKLIFLHETCYISIQISFSPIDDNPTLVQIMAWHQTSNKPLSEPVMA